MDDLRGFIETGLTAAKNALIHASARVGLHLRPDTISKARARRFMASLRAIETVVRRLILLLAAGIELAPPAPRQPSAKPTPGGPRANSFTLLRAGSFDGDALAALSGRRAAPSNGPVSTRPLIDRYDTLTRLLADPERAARRMARMLAAMKTAKAPRPYCLPQTETFRMDAELGLVANALPHLVSEALAGWYDTS